jgi:hypothetical protein
MRSHFLTQSSWLLLAAAELDVTAAGAARAFCVAPPYAPWSEGTSDRHSGRARVMVRLGVLCPKRSQAKEDSGQYRDVMRAGQRPEIV